MAFSTHQERLEVEARITHLLERIDFILKSAKNEVDQVVVAPVMFPRSRLMPMDKCTTCQRYDYDGLTCRCCGKVAVV